MNQKDFWKMEHARMRLFSKRHNIYKDDATKRRKVLGLIGGLIMLVIFIAWACILLDCVYIESGRQLLIGRM